MKWQVLIFPLSMPPEPYFAQRFRREQDALDYVEFWTRLGSCHIRKEQI